MSRKLNILIAIESFWDGGAEIFAIRLANVLSKENNIYFIELFPHLTTNKKQKNLLNKNSVRVFQPGKNIIGNILKKSNKKSNFFYKRIESVFQKTSSLQIKFVLWYYKIEIINSHSWDSDFYFSKLKDEFNFRLVSTFHGHYEYLRNLRNDFDTSARFALSKIDQIVYTTSSHLDVLNYFNYPVSKSNKIFYGISSNLEKIPTKFESGESLKVVMVARGIKEKGWEEAILAVLEIQQKYPNSIELYLLGEGVFLDNLKSLYTNDAIKFCGYQEDVYKFINSSHIGILPSYYEGESLPNSIIEYLTCGKPVIATNIGAIKEMLGFDGYTAGFIIDLYNGKVNYEDLIKAIEIYLNDPSIVKEQSQRAINAAQKFSMSNCISEYKKIFQNSLGS